MALYSKTPGPYSHVLLPAPILYALFDPAAAVSRAALVRSQKKWYPFRYFKPSMSPSEHNRHLLWTPGMFELLERARGARS